MHDDAGGVDASHGASAGPCREGCRLPPDRFRPFGGRSIGAGRSGREGLEAVGCGLMRHVHLRLDRLEKHEMPEPFRVLLWSVPARARLCSGRRCGAAQRYPTSFWTATSAPLRSSSSIASKWPFCAAKCSGVRLHGGRRDSARRFIRRARTERLARSRLGRRRRLSRQSVLGRSGDCRSTPHSAARCAHHTCKRRGERAGPTGYPAQPIPENETGGPEVDIVSFRERRTARVLREDSAY